MSRFYGKPNSGTLEEEYCLESLLFSSEEEPQEGPKPSSGDTPATATIADKNSGPPNPFHLSHVAMSHALNVSEITYLIRQELRGADLKTCVRVHSSWWQCFAPYLWERIFIDSDPEQGDRTVIFRNGLAARSLTLSIYDQDVLQAMAAGRDEREHEKDELGQDHQKSSKGVIAYVAERCRNITSLKLKLFSSLLLVRSPKENNSKDWHGHGHELGTENDSHDIEEETFQTPVLDALFQKLPHVTDLSLSIAHEDLEPALIRSVRHLPKLQKLTVLGGLRGNEFYLVKKNYKCNWPKLVQILKSSCPQIESLTVAWESSKSSPSSSLSPPLAFQQQLPQGSPLLGLRSFHFCYARIQNDHQLDPLFQSCPNLRHVSMDTVWDPLGYLNAQLLTMVKVCPRIVSFKFLHPVQVSYGDIFDFQFFHSLPENHSLSEIVLSTQGQNNRIFWDREPITSAQTLEQQEAHDRLLSSPAPIFSREFQKNLDALILPRTLTNLTLLDLQEMSMVWTALQVFSRLERLTLGGHGRLPSQWVNDPYYHYSYNGIELGLSEIQVKEVDSTLVLACADTLQYLDLSQFELKYDKNFHTFFKIVVQRLKRLKHLHLTARSLSKAYLEETWSYEPEEDAVLEEVEEVEEEHEEQQEEEEELDELNQGQEQGAILEGLLIGEYEYEHNDFEQQDQDQVEFAEETGDPSQGEDGLDSGNQEQDNANNENEDDPFSYLPEEYRQNILREKVFVHFESLEFLYLHGAGQTLTSHSVSALIRAMPKLRVLAFPRFLGGTKLNWAKKEFAKLTFVATQNS